MNEYLVVYEHDNSGWSAYVPDLPGCVATAPDRGEVETLIREAIPLHIGTLRDAGEPVPAPTSRAEKPLRHTGA